MDPRQVASPPLAPLDTAFHPELWRSAFAGAGDGDGDGAGAGAGDGEREGEGEGSPEETCADGSIDLPPLPPEVAPPPAFAAARSPPCSPAEGGAAFGLRASDVAAAVLDRLVAAAITAPPPLPPPTKAAPAGGAGGMGRVRGPPNRTIGPAPAPPGLGGGGLTSAAEMSREAWEALLLGVEWELMEVRVCACNNCYTLAVPTPDSFLPPTIYVCPPVPSPILLSIPCL